MTRPRHDSHSTEFGLWLREQEEIDSELGYVATNIDYVWRNYRAGKWLFIEEKRYGRKPRPFQWRIFDMINRLAQKDSNYQGFFLIQFENTDPDDGRMWINGKLATRDDLMNLLRFNPGAVEEYKAPFSR